MRRIVLAWAVAGLFAAASAPFLFAGDAPPAAAPEDARIKRLVEDLGSDDFRVREAASKELTGMGEKARPALEAAMKSDSPAVRFRAEQILDGLNGAPKEKALGEGTPQGEASPHGERPRGVPPEGLRPEDWDREMNRLREEMDRRMRELEETFRSGRLDLPWGPFFRDAQRSRLAREYRLKADGGKVWAELFETPRTARIVLTDKEDPANVTTYAGASVAKILASRPEVRDMPGVKDLLAKYEEEKKAREEAAKQAPPGDGGGRAVEGRSVQIVQGPKGMRVTITETGPDGKAVSKTYEGADLDAIRREHPEIADSLRGFSVHVGPLAPAPDDGSPGERPLGPLEPGEDESGAMTVPGAPAGTRTGPFGLALGVLDEHLRAQVPLAPGEGALVLAVRPDSEAAKVGLRVDDVIASVNGTAVTSLDAVGNAIRARAPGAAMTFEVLRGGKRITLPEATPPK